MTATSLIMAKLNATLKSGYQNIWGVSPLTEKRVKPGYQTTAIFDHIFNYSTCSPAEDNDFSILARESNDFKLTLMESLLIERDRPDLNRSIKSMPLELFNNIILHVIY